LGAENVTGLGLVRCTSVFDDACNFNPTFDEEITHRMEADHILLAVGQTGDLEFVKNEKTIKTHGGQIEVRAEDLSTDKKGVFAGGDVVSGPDSIIGAIAHGRRAAAAIDLHLGGDGDIDEVLAHPEEEVLLREFMIEVNPRNEMALLKPWERMAGFDHVELGLTEEQIAAETGRCLNCDARKFEVLVNTEYCKECGYCEEVCGVDAFGPADSFNVKGYRPMECRSSDWCVGCFKCYFACPDFAIDVKEAAE
jgi:NAD-dependent dihydropyrimidine dehydrogenase PreA subunit